MNYQHTSRQPNLSFLIAHSSFKKSPRLFTRGFHLKSVLCSLLTAHCLFQVILAQPSSQTLPWMVSLTGVKTDVLGVMLPEPPV
jgi:hypothetical protein